MLTLDQIDDIGRTAFIVAEWRHEDNDHPHPLVKDAIVGKFLSPITKELAKFAAQALPLAKDWAVYRAKYFDEHLLNAMQSGAKQVLILGSGLDTRALRYNRTNVKFYEIDKLEILDFKQKFLTESLPKNIFYIPGDYLANDLIELLRKHSFSFSEPTYIIWEGNNMYLPKSEVKRIFKILTDNIQNLSISFDYLSEEMIAKQTGVPELTALVETFAEMGSPWITGFTDITEISQKYHLNLIDNYSVNALGKTYRPEDFDHVAEDYPENFYFVCTVSKA